MTDLAIATEKLTRRFGALTAVDNIDLCVTAGQFFGFWVQTERENPQPLKC